MNSKFCLTSAFVTVSFLAACGDKRDSVSSGYFPTIDMTVPDNAATTSVVVQPGLSVFTTTLPSLNVMADTGYRFKLSIDRINSVLSRLNTSKQVSATGTFTAKVEGGTVTGIVKDIEDDTYSREATLCVDANAYLDIKWNDDKTKVKVIRDFSQTPLSIIPTTAMKTEFNYEVAADGTKSAKSFSYGKPYYAPADVKATDGNDPYLAEAVEASLTTAGVFSLKGANDWSAAAFASTTFAGDAFITGQIAADGSGSYVATRIFSGCNSFDPASPTDATSGYCFTGQIAAGGTVTHSLFHTSDWTTGLQAIGTEANTSLKVVDFDAGISCTK